MRRIEVNDSQIALLESNKLEAREYADVSEFERMGINRSTMTQLDKAIAQYVVNAIFKISLEKKSAIFYIILNQRFDKWDMDSVNSQQSSQQLFQKFNDIASTYMEMNFSSIYPGSVSPICPIEILKKKIQLSLNGGAHNSVPVKGNMHIIECLL